MRPVVLAGIAAVAVSAAVLAAILLRVGMNGQAGQPGPTSAAPAAAAPLLVEEAAGAGLAHTYEGDFEFYVGGGVAAFDCNADLGPDLYLAGGSEAAALFVNRSGTGTALRFERQPAEVTDLVAVTGAYPIDVDSDGITDLAVLRRGEKVLLRGLGDCRFERANEAWHFDGGDAWSTAFSAKWDRGARWPTLAVGNYVDESSDDPNRLCSDNYLFAPAPAGVGFGPPAVLSPGWCTLSVLFSDWDRSGRRDLRVSNDRHYYRDTGGGEEQLWRVEPGATPSLYTREEGWQRVRVFGMGIAGYDVTGDGYPEYYLTSQADNKLQTLAEGPDEPRYSDIALRRGALAHRPYAGDTSLPSTAWHDEFDDLNNDGYIDLFVAKGNVETQPDHAARDPSNLLLGQPDGTFREAAIEAGLLDFGRARGAAVVDLNGDGLLDLVVVDRRENVRLYRNVGAGSAEATAAMGNWISVRISQQGTNRDAIGSWVEARFAGRTVSREVTIGGGHASGALGPVHIGLGAATSAEVRVIWPDGDVGTWQRMEANTSAVVTPDGIELVTR